jgi:uncharacterized protein DUF6573
MDDIENDMNRKNADGEVKKGEKTMTNTDEVFGEVIYSYTRAQAIEDGVLVDVTPMAREAGFVYPVALTRAVWNRYVEVPNGVTGQDEIGRLWDIVWMCWLAARRHNSGEMKFQLLVRNDDRPGEPPLVTLKAHCGPGDQAEPVVTIMLPDED